MVIRGGADLRGALVTDRKLDRSRKLSAISWFCFTPLKYHILRLQISHQIHGVLNVNLYLVYEFL